MASFSYSYKKGVRKLFPKKFLLPFFLIAVGILSLLYVGFPILSFQITQLPKFSQGELIFPIPNILLTTIVNTSGTDFSRASSWYPNPEAKKEKPTTSYFFSIPKLKIEDAVVSTTSDDLFKNLIHYGPSSLPGELGNAVVFGHSTLPQLFNPKNYKTIFSTLHTLEIGDEIQLEVDGVTYEYSISSIKITDPDDISVLEQQYEGSYLTVITCTPPGTYWKRLIIKGKLTPSSSI